MNRLFLAATTLLLFTTACREPVVRGKGTTISQPRAADAYFNKLAIVAPIDVSIEVNPGAPAGISISGYENILPYIITRVKDSTLHIEMKDGVHVYHKDGMTASITMPMLARLSTSGSSDAVVKGAVTGPKFEIEKSGSGDITVAVVSVDEFSVEIAGSSDVTIQGGTTGKAAYSIAGSGGVKAFGLQTTETAIDIAGSGDAEISANTKLDVDVAGSGDVRYKGHPVVTKSIVGSGDLSDAN